MNGMSAIQIRLQVYGTAETGAAYKRFLPLKIVHWTSENRYKTLGILFAEKPGRIFVFSPDKPHADTIRL